MLSYINGSIEKISVHKIGNESAGGFCNLSEKPLDINDETLSAILMQYFTNSFLKTNEVYRLHHSSGDNNLNEIFHFTNSIFSDPGNFHENSKSIARHLFDVSTHPNIKTGEFYVVHLSNLQIEGEEIEAIGLFKSENKETFLKVYPENNGFQLEYEQEAISIKKLDKGAIIFNTEKEEGYKVLVTDNTNRNGESVYWVDDFLKLKIRNDQYNKTSNTLNLYKTFVTEQMDDEFGISKPEKIDLLNRSIKYFKEKDVFEFDDFSNEVIGNPQGIESFRNFKKNYEDEFQSEIGDSFSISNAAVKKQTRFFKSVLKLDKNFHIYIHGSNDLIEKGFDETVNKNFYKIYFNEEH